jgi:hypothetical protein
MSLMQCADPSAFERGSYLRLLQNVSQPADAPAVADEGARVTHGPRQKRRSR